MTVAHRSPTSMIAPAPELRGNNLALGWCTDREVCLDGPAGCVAGETLIYNPITEEHTQIKELCEKRIAPIVQTLMGAIQAEVPFRKGVKDLYRVTLVSGRECVVTDNHRFLTPGGWRFASSCVIGSRLLVSLPCPRPTIEASGPLMSQQDALRLSQTPLGSQERCDSSHYHDDVQPLWGGDNDLTSVPSQGDAHVRTHDGLYRDDLGFLSGCNRQSLSSDHHARMCYSPLSDDRACTLSHDLSETSLQVDYPFRYAAQSQIEKPLLSPTAQPLPDDDNMRHLGREIMEHQPFLSHPIHDASACSTLEQLAPYSLSSGMSQEFAESLPALCACTLSCDPSSAIKPSARFEYTTQWDTVASIKYERTDEYFDLHVPLAEHYLAEGIWHHNTGKTTGALFKVHVLLSKYPNARALVCRKTNTALSGSAMVTYRESIIRGRHDIYYFGGNKVEPAAFRYPNGSEMIVNGLDKPEKVQSSEFDWAYIVEATETELADAEFVRMRLRPRANGPKVPYRQLIMDVNPGHPNHWLNLRMNEGTTTRLLSRHEDNPRYWDVKTRDWTEEGREYIFGILGGLTGVRLARYRYGIWAAAEGTIFEDSWDAARNVVKPFPVPAEWARYLVIDFGFTHPFVCLWCAIDPDGRIYVYRQIYMTKKLVEDHAKDIKKYSRWGLDGGDPLPREIICDHDAEGRATLERHLGLHTTKAYKKVLEGIQAVSARFLPARDDRPRLMIMQGCLVEVDRELQAAKRPTCTEDEPEVYVWRTGTGVQSKEEPVKEFDHGLDCIRYLCASRDLKPNTIGYSQRVY